MIGRKTSQPDSEIGQPDNMSGLKSFDDFDLRLGDVMRGERATIGKSLLDVERDLRIKAPYLAAIENGDLSAFDTPSFIAGYVRSYARYLRMDPDESFQNFCKETGFKVAHGMSPSASTAPVAALRGKQQTAFGSTALGSTASDPRFDRSFSPQERRGTGIMEPGMLGSIAVLLGVICFVGYGGYSVLQAVQRVDLAPVDLAPVVIAEAGVTIQDPKTATAPMVVAGLDPATRVVQPQALDVPVLVARDGPISAIDPRKTNLAVTPQNDTDSQEIVKVVTDVKPGVEILAARPSWISVSSADGTVLFEKILDAGETYVVPALEVAPRLRAGNSSAVYFVVDGTTFGPAATGPQVVKNVDLSAASLSNTYAVADLTADRDLAQFTAQNMAVESPDP